MTWFNAFLDPVTVTRSAPLTGVVSGFSGGNAHTSRRDFLGGVALTA